MGVKEAGHRNSNGLLQYTMGMTGQGLLSGLKQEHKIEGKVRLHQPIQYVCDDLRLQRHQGVRKGKCQK